MSQGNFGNLCDTNNFGDPVVLYDSFEDRWFITDFAFTLDGSGNVVNPPGSFQCFAVSKTGDPVAGGWNFYSINTAGGLGDYPKFGIWPDGIYMSANMFDYAAGGVVPEPAGLRAEQGADVRREPDGPGRDVRRSVGGLHAAAEQRAAAGRHAAARHAQLLRLHLAVPERADRLQVPRRLGQDLAVDVHGPGHPARRHQLAECDRSERAVAGRQRPRRPPDPGDDAEPVHATSAASSRSGPPTRFAGRDTSGFAAAALVPGERHRRHGGGEPAPGRHVGSRRRERHLPLHAQPRGRPRGRHGARLQHVEQRRRSPPIKYAGRLATDPVEHARPDRAAAHPGHRHADRQLRRRRPAPAGATTAR